MPLAQGGSSVAVGARMQACGSCSVSRRCPPLLCGVSSQLVTWDTSPTAHRAYLWAWQWSKVGQDSQGPGDHTDPAAGVSVPVLSLPGHRGSCP